MHTYVSSISRALLIELWVVYRLQFDLVYSMGIYWVQIDTKT